MRRSKKLLCAAIALSLSDCASVASTFVGKPVDASGHIVEASSTTSGLVISGQERTAYASRNFGLLEVTLENQSSDWVRISRLSLDFGDTARGEVSLPVEPDVSAWYRATLQRNDIRDTNEATALGALVLLGAAAVVVGHVSDKPAVKALGAAAMAGGETASLARGVDTAIESAERVPMVPETHLLALPFAVPPGLFSKRWVLINTRNDGTPCVRGVLLDYDVEGHGRERVLLRFRKLGSRSEWQRSACQLEAAVRQAQSTSAN